MTFVQKIKDCIGLSIGGFYYANRKTKQTKRIIQTTFREI
jgi:hypothetical protein